MVTKRKEDTVGSKAVRRGSMADIWDIISSSVVGPEGGRDEEKEIEARLQGTPCVWFNAVAPLFWSPAPCGPHTSAVSQRPGPTA